MSAIMTTIANEFPLRGASKKEVQHFEAIAKADANGSSGSGGSGSGSSDFGGDSDAGEDSADDYYNDFYSY